MEPKDFKDEFINLTNKYTMVGSNIYTPHCTPEYVNWLEHKLITIIDQRLSKIKYWINESMLERDSSDDGFTDHESNADYLLNEAIKLCNYKL